MANDEHVTMLKKSVAAWNAWRDENPNIRPDLMKADLKEVNLSGANFSGADLEEADLSWANLSGANLSGAYLSEANLAFANLTTANFSKAALYMANLYMADLVEADLVEADLVEASVWDADLSGANLSGASLNRVNFNRADLSGANLSGADLSEANLQGATLVDTDLTGADLTGCRIYGVSAWGTKLDEAKQRNLVISPENEPTVTVDDIEVAQFIYLMLNNQKVRNVIDTITSKAVLILGRFTDERKAVLDAIREELRNRDLLPILFDFERPDSKDLTGTVQTLASMARFIIADLTDPSCIPHELAMVVPGTVVPVQPVLLQGQREYAMFVDLKRRYGWVLEPYVYASQRQLIANLLDGVIRPAETKVLELRGTPKQ